MSVGPTLVSDLKQLEQVMIAAGEIQPDDYDVYVPGMEADRFYSLGDKLLGTDFKITSLTARGVDTTDSSRYRMVRIEVMSESVKEPYFAEFEIDQPIFRADKISPELYSIYVAEYHLTPGLDTVGKIVGLPLGEKPKAQPKEQLAGWRRKTLNCSELLNDIFLFPETATATMFVSSWFADGAKVILSGVPGTGKTTLIESSTLLYLCDRYRYEDAKFYYRNNFVPESDIDPSVRRTGFAYYKIGDKAQKPFNVLHYLNMYRKHWARCPQCSRPATLKDVIGTSISERGAQKHWFRCENPNCTGRKADFSTKAGESVKNLIGQEVVPTEDKDKVGFDEGKKTFASKEQAEKFMTDYKGAGSPDYLWVEQAATGWQVRVCSHSKGYVFGRENFEPLLGIAKITPKKRPEEIFYYTEIEKEISAGKERFLMPPRARPIVKANVKFFNEFNRCLAPGTLVVRRDGAIVSIDALAIGDEIAGFARGEGSDWVKVKSKFVRPTEKALEIGLLGGHKFVMSGNHHCVLFENGTFVHKRADEILKGDVFVQSSELALPVEHVSLVVSAQDDIVVEVSPEFRGALASKKSELGWTYDQLAQASGVSRSVVHNLLSGNYFGSTVGTVRAVSETLCVEGVVSEVEGRSYSVALPTTMTPDVSEVLGYFTGDGSMTAGGVGFTDESKDLLVHYETILKSWGLKTVIAPVKGGWRLRVNNIFFADWLRENFSDAKQGVPSQVMRSGREGVISYLRGLFDAEGWVNTRNKTVNISMTTTHIEQVQLLLRALGVSSNLSLKDPYSNHQSTHSLNLTGLNVQRFRDIIGFNHPERAGKLSALTWKFVHGDKVPAKCVDIPEEIPQVHRFDVGRAENGNGMRGFTRDRWEKILGSLGQPAFTEPVSYLPVVSTREVDVEEGYLVDIEVEEKTERGFESDHVFLAGALLLTGNSKPEVQDEVLSLLEEGEVEYKGESFYSNTPFVAFFDLNPHKEERERVLDWAFYDRLDCQLTMPSMNFGNKLEILTTRVNIRQAVFEQLMSDVCNACGAMVLRGEDKCFECGSGDIHQGVEPLFIDELDMIRKEIRDSVKVSEEAYFALAIISDLYGRSYYRYTAENPIKELRKKELGLTDEQVNPFVDISTAQWWPKIRKAEGRGIDDESSEKASTEGGPGKAKLFMMTKGGGLERPLGFRVCMSVLKMAKSRAWFLTMTDGIKVGDRARSLDPAKRLPEMVKEETSDADVRKLKMAKQHELAKKKTDPRTIRAEVAKIKKSTYYRFLECPNCGEKCPPTIERGKRHTCSKCKYPFYPVFQIILTPEDVLAVFPYCASMRFCADYDGSFIPDEVWRRYPNVTDWLKDETSRLWADADFQSMFKLCREAFGAALESCTRTDLTPARRRKDALDAMKASDYSKKAKNYPFYYQGIDYVASSCGEKGYADRWPGAPPVQVEAAKAGDPPETEFGIGREKVKRKRQSWDRPPE